MSDLSKGNQTMSANGNSNQPLGSRESIADIVLKPSIKAYNALFTPMGRKNLYFFLKKIRARLNSDFRANGTMLYKLANGNSFLLHRGDCLSEQIYLEGAYEPLETMLVSKIACRGDVALDIGANVGYYTALLDGLVKPDGVVHCFEPGEATFRRLGETRNLLHLDRASLHAKAISDASGPIEFWMSEAGLDGQQSTQKNSGLGQQARCTRVEAITVDAFAADLKTRDARSIAFVKCDIEGAELSMLKGAQTLLQSENPPIWLIEHNRKVLLAHGVETSDLLSFFREADVYYVPMCWPPSIIPVKQVTKWNGVPDALPDECNLLIFPRRGIYAKRAAALYEAGLIA
jgi:FkbM family methyltransferase